MKTITNKTHAMLVIEQREGAMIEELLRVKYVDERKSIEVIASELGVSFMTVYKWLQRINVTSRGFTFEDT